MGKVLGSIPSKSIFLSLCRSIVVVVVVFDVLDVWWWSFDLVKFAEGAMWVETCWNGVENITHELDGMIRHPHCKAIHMFGL
jgi:hypothetical protein